jgi:hypothetical protein
MKGVTSDISHTRDAAGHEFGHPDSPPASHPMIQSRIDLHDSKLYATQHISFTALLRAATIELT